MDEENNQFNTLELYLERPKKANGNTYHYETRPGNGFRQSNFEILEALNIPIIIPIRRLTFGYHLNPANSLEEISQKVKDQFKRETEGYFKDFFYSELHVYELNSNETLSGSTLEIMKLELLFMKNAPEIRIASPFRKLLFSCQDSYHLFSKSKSSIRRVNHS